MEFGLFTEFHSPPGVSEAAAFDESLAQMKANEDFGFDAVWLGAAPLIIASALAACTRRVKIGIAVQVLRWASSGRSARRSGNPTAPPRRRPRRARLAPIAWPTSCTT